MYVVLRSMYTYFCPVRSHHAINQNHDVKQWILAEVTRNLRRVITNRVTAYPRHICSELYFKKKLRARNYVCGAGEDSISGGSCQSGRWLLANQTSGSTLISSVVSYRIVSGKPIDFGISLRLPLFNFVNKMRTYK